MKRREFLKSLGYAAAVSLASESISVATPTAAWSQTAEKSRRVGVLFSGLSSGPGARPVVLQALVDGLREHGWEEGRNVVLEVRYAGGGSSALRRAGGGPRRTQGRRHHDQRYAGARRGTAQDNDDTHYLDRSACDDGPGLH